MAILCNHQRSVPKKHSEQLDKLKKQVEELQAEKAKLVEQYRAAKEGKSLDDSEEEGTPKKKKDPARIKKAIQKLDERIKNRQVEIEQKDELKTVALGTSKINYMDPRITAAWCKKHGVRDPRLASLVTVRSFDNSLYSRFRLRRSSPRLSETSFRGRWTWMKILDINSRLCCTKWING